MISFQAAQEFEVSAAKDVLLTVITVVRNDAARLRTTISSLAWFYRDERYEHIVIDGWSGDQTLEVLQNNQVHENFRYISEPDDGLYDAMNKGVRLASGKFLLFLNCGDLMVASPEQVSSWLSQIAAENKMDVVCFCCRVRHGARSTILRPRVGLPYKMPTSHQAMVFSKELMKAHPFNTRYSIAADYDLYLSASAERVLLFTAREALTDIEGAGIASGNPARSYKECFQIAAKKLYGTTRWIVLAIIGCKGVAVVALKKTLPKNWLRKFREACDYQRAR
jgi:putative colanic acid biosynthesis glycosyltransferase